MWRAARGLLLCLLGSAVLFLLVQALPGDAASLAAGSGGPEAVARMRERMGLDVPLPRRYLSWLGGVLTGDFGTTLNAGVPVWRAVATPLMATFTVMAIVLLALALVTLPAAVAAGARPRARASRGAAAAALGVVAVPEFVTAIVASAILCHWLGWLPVLSTPGGGQTAWERPIVLAMPSLCLWIVCSAFLFRRARALIAAHSRAAYVVEAELAGMPRRRVLLAHLLPSAAYGIGQLFAQTVPYLLGGTVVIEVVVSYPGLGYTLVTAVTDREAPTVMAIGAVLMLAAAVAFTLADLAGRRNQRVVAVV
ncbi:MAG: ABC transporter permease [Actinomyces sp.]|nr:MAG: ABC transporter permease [Actinomyces sp.]